MIPENAPPTESPTTPDVIAQLLSLPKFGTGIGLHRMRFLLEEIADSSWFHELDTIRVTGSKGKGSVSVLIARILSEFELRVGLYTSPHLWHFEERIQFDGQPIPREELERVTAWAMKLKGAYEQDHPGDRVGAFEVYTAMAARWFMTRGPCAVVAEAGIGGRYDPTRLLPGSVVALTSVELEHTELLGSSLELIAFDKSDLCPTGGTLVTGALDAELLRRLETYCQVRGVEVVHASDEVTLKAPTFSAGKMHFGLTFRGKDYGTLSSRLLGEHQARNAALAMVAAHRWLLRHRSDVPDAKFEAAVRAALTHVEWAGRMQQVCEAPVTYIDVAHTPASARCAARTMRAMYPSKPILLLTGASANKDIRGILQELVPVADAIVATSARHRGEKHSKIAETCGSLRPEVPCRAAEDLVHALRLVKEEAARRNAVVLIAGGLFLAIEALEVLRGGRPEDLHFF